MREESKHTEPVVDGDEHDALLSQGFSVITRSRTGAGLIAARVNPDHDWPPLAGRSRRSPDIEKEAVLADFGRGCGRIRAAKCRLHAHRPELIGFQNTIPMRHGLRRAPAQLS